MENMGDRREDIGETDDDIGDRHWRCNIKLIWYIDDLIISRLTQMNDTYSATMIQYQHRQQQQQHGVIIYSKP